MWQRVASPAHADLSRRRDYVSLDGFADVSRKIEDAIHEEWRAVPPCRNLFVVSQLLRVSTGVLVVMALVFANLAPL
jgi:hypothetical protein